jgi:hypothetical protein
MQAFPALAHAGIAIRARHDLSVMSSIPPAAAYHHKMMILVVRSNLHMKKFLAMSAATIALAAPSIASAGTPGFVDVRLGAIDANEAEFTTMGAGGSVVAPLSGNWNVQFDADFTRQQIEGVGFSGSGLSAHIFHDGGEWALGALLDYEDTALVTYWTLGAEAQYTIGSFVFEAGAGFGTVESFGGNADTGSANASLTWYANEDLSFAGGISYRDVDAASLDSTTYSLDAEYRLEGSPFSVIGGFAFSDLDLGIESTGWTIGLRYGFGDATLQARRNEGPRWLRESSADAIVLD